VTTVMCEAHPMMQAHTCKLAVQIDVWLCAVDMHAQVSMLNAMTSSGLTSV